MEELEQRSSDVNGELTPLTQTEILNQAAHKVEEGLLRIKKVQQSLVQVAILMKEGKFAHGNIFFAHCVEGLEQFYEAVSILKAVFSLDQLKANTFQDVSFSQLEEQFLFILKGIVSSQEKKDYRELADRLDYELVPHLSFWILWVEAWYKQHFSNA